MTSSSFRGLKLLRLLLWKNLLLQKRRPWWTFMGIFLPLLLIIIIMGFRQKVEPEIIEDPVVFESFSVDGIPRGSAGGGGGFGGNRKNRVVGPKSAKYTIAYSPKNRQTYKIMRKVALRLHLKKLRGFKNESTMVDYILKKRAFALATSGAKEILPGISIGGRSDSATILCGVAFDATDWKAPLDDAAAAANANVVDYTIRFPHSPPSNFAKFSKYRRGDHWFTERVYPRRSTVGPRGANGYGSDTPGYYTQGFLAVQWAINHEVMKLATKNSSLFDDVVVALKQFAYPPYFDDPYTSGLQAQFPFLLMICFSICSLDIVRNVAVEKQEKLKETMKIMGLPNWLHWLAWFIKSFVYMVVIMVIMSGLLKAWVPPNGRVISFTQWSVLLAFFLVYAVALICFSFMITTIFNKANTAAAAGGVIFFISFIPYFFAAFNYDALTFGNKIAFCLSFNTCMGLGCKLLGMFEGKGTGISWATVSAPIYSDDDFAMTTVWVMLLFDALLCSCVAWYLEGVRPGDFGVALPWYFPFTKSYWCGGSVSSGEKDEPFETTAADNEEMEALTEKRDESEEKKFGIEVRNLRKVFGNGCGQDATRFKVAVKGISMEMAENEIFVLLGHNGAGKSTTISMLTGMYSPSGGDAFIGRKSIRTDMREIRRGLGLCPQHDVLFDNLTVYEHLVFFGRLKDSPKEAMEEEIDSLLNDLELDGKKMDLAQTLSGGQKRKLSVAIALIGKSKVVLLDEPSSGMDPSARRLTWNVLKKYNPGRTILLTTHFMDEADVLGDVITIMASGKVVCAGSPLFLKTKLGVGYHLVIVKAPHYNSEATSSLVKSHVSEAVVERDIRAEVAFSLPKDRVRDFSPIFSALEANKEAWGIVSFGCAVSSIEEVFLRVGDDETAMAKLMSAAGPPSSSSSSSSDPHHPQSEEKTTSDGHDGGDNDEKRDEPSEKQREVASAVDNGNKSGSSETTKIVRNKGLALAFQQFYAMLVKRILHTRRNRLVTVAQLLVPNLFTLLILFIIQISPDLGDSPKLALNLLGFGPTSSPFHFYEHKINATSSSSLAAAMRLTYPKLFQTSTKDSTVAVVESLESPFANVSVLDKYALRFSTESLRQYTDRVIVGAEVASLDRSCFRARGRTVRGYLETLDREATEKERKKLNDEIVQRFKGSRYSAASGGRVCQTYVKMLELEANVSSSSAAEAGDATIESLHEANGSKILVEGYFNDNPLHSPAITLEAVSNAMLRSVANVTIVSHNHPLPRTVNDKLDDVMTVNFRFSGSFNFGFLYGMSFLGASFIVFLVKERVSKSKHIQILSGVHYVNFWLATFVWDYVNFLVPCFFTVVLLYVFEIEAFIEAGIYNVVVLMLVFGLGQLPFVYCLSLLFRESTAGFVYTSVLNIFVGLSLMIAIGILKAVDLAAAADVIQGVALAFSPPFVIGHGMQNLYVNYWNFRMCNLDLPSTRDLFKSFIPTDALENSGFSWFGPIDEDELLDWFEDEKIFEESAGIPLTLGEILAMPPREALCVVVEAANVSFPCCANSGCEETIVGCSVHVPYLSLEMPGVGQDLLYFLAQFVAFFTILFVYESEILRLPFYALQSKWRRLRGAGCRGRVGGVGRKAATPRLEETEMAAEGFYNRSASVIDADVEAERQRIAALWKDAPRDEMPLLVLKELKKVYPSRDVPAVDGISLGIPKGELFGLLGLNGAGKTTTFKMLTGDETVTEGNAVLSGVFDVRSDLRQMQQRMGYCPQSDALIDQMTGRETLRMYARLRGVPEKRIDAMINDVTKDLLLEDHIGRLVGGYSGGNKRKLGTAIALIGDPQLVLLDEPTTGMDPVARRLLWDALIRIRDRSQQCIVLTSHSMEECDTLCTRLAIMVNGRFMCLGSPQYLKGKFGEGFHLVVRLKRRPAVGKREDDDDPASEASDGKTDSFDRVANFIRFHFPETCVEDASITAAGTLVCRIPENPQLTWSKVFQVMESAKSEQDVEDYLLSQTTLEKVFLNFAKYQRIEDD